MLLGFRIGTRSRYRCWKSRRSLRYIPHGAHPCNIAVHCAESPSIGALDFAIAAIDIWRPKPLGQMASVHASCSRRSSAARRDRLEFETSWDEFRGCMAGVVRTKLQQYGTIKMVSLNIELLSNNSCVSYLTHSCVLPLVSFIRR